MKFPVEIIFFRDKIKEIIGSALGDFLYNETMELTSKIEIIHEIESKIG